MWLLSIVIVAIFLWLVLNLPLTRKNTEDTYDKFLQEAEKRREKQ